MSDTFFSFWEKKIHFLDVHYHARPDSFVRRCNALQAGEAYQQAGGGVVLKNHLGSTTALASLAQEQGLPVFGSVVLNAISGGLSLDTVRQALCQYAFKYSGRLLVHLPTVVPSKHRSRLSRTPGNRFVTDFAGKSLSISEDGVRLKHKVIELLHMASNEPIVLSTGHATFDEIRMLLEAAEQIGNIKIMLNQPANPITGMSASDLKSLGKIDWIFIEQTALTVLLGYQTEDDLVSVLKNCHNLIYSSDLGQTTQPDISQWMSLSDQWFRKANLSNERKKAIKLGNPLSMLNDQSTP